MAHIPVARGLAVCEQVIVEEGTRNVKLVNCFTTRVVPAFPVEAQPFVVLAFLADGFGEITMEVVVQRLDTLGIVDRASRIVCRKCVSSTRCRGACFPSQAPMSFTCALTSN